MTTWVASGGKFIVSQGGWATDTEVYDGGELIVCAGGLAEGVHVIDESYVTISSGGQLTIASGGSATSTNIESAAQLIISSGVIVDKVIIDTGGQLTIDSGGYVNGAYISSGGQLTILSAGTGDYISIDSGGQFVVASGGSAGDTYVYWGHFIISEGGSARATYLGSNAQVTFTKDGYGQNVMMLGNGQVIISGGLVEQLDVAMGGQGTVLDGGIINTAYVDSGQLIVSGGFVGDVYVGDTGLLIVSSGGKLNGTATITAYGSAIIYPDVGGSVNLVEDTNGSLTLSGLENGGVLTTVIDGFSGNGAGDSDSIKLAGINQSNVSLVEYKDAQGNDNGDFITFTLSNGNKITLNIIGAQKAGYTLGTSDDGSLIFEVCFLSGSMIRTLNGEIAVENISIGDEVLTFDWQQNKQVVRSVSWVGSKDVKVKTYLTDDDEAGYPVRVLKDAVAAGIPYKDLLVTSEHCLFFDGQFIPVRMLVNGYSIYYDHTITNYTYYHIETEEHSVIWADGMLTESYLDTGNRAQFKQHGNFAVLTSKYASKTWEKDAGAPLSVCRHDVEPLYHLLLQRAMEMNLPEIQDQKLLTNDPGLHLITQEGLAIQPSSIQNGQYIFCLSEGVKQIYLVSRTSRPSDVIGSFVDDRRYLGVLVGDIDLVHTDHTCKITEHLEQPDLLGWDVVEQAPCRWTKGKALLNILNVKNKKCILIINVLCSNAYIIKQDEVKTQKIA